MCLHRFWQDTEGVDDPLLIAGQIAELRLAEQLADRNVEKARQVIEIIKDDPAAFWRLSQEVRDLLWAQSLTTTRLAIPREFGGLAVRFEPDTELGPQALRRCQAWHDIDSYSAFFTIR